MTAVSWTCQHCGERLLGWAYHCRGCCRTFVSMEAYDLHRPHRSNGKVLDLIVCHPPNEVGLASGEHAYWLKPKRTGATHPTRPANADTAPSHHS